MPDALCVIHIDGASKGNPGPAGVGAVLRDERNNTLAEISKPIGLTTNNVAEYLSAVYALQEAQRLGCKDVYLRTDSQLLSRQVEGRYKVKDPELKRLHGLVMELARHFDSFVIEHIPRELNADADRLADAAARLN